MRAVIANFVMSHGWVWPTAEILHFHGLAVMFGTLTIFDLRVLGFARGLPIGRLHALVRLAQLAFAVNLLTGSLFFLSIPAQYLVNAAFSLKLVSLVLMGLNVAWFYLGVWPRLRSLGPNDDAPPAAKLSAALSLLLLLAVATFGRYTAFYKYVPLWP